jgi:trehalose 6-phosphate phosphatase
VLRDGDVGVKVGPGDTAAEYRVDDPEAVVSLFALLTEERRLHVGA